MRRIVLVASVVLIIPSASHADLRLHVAGTYNMGILTSSQEGVSDRFAPVGLGLNLGLYLAEQWRVGVSTGWQHYSEEDSDPIEFVGETVTGRQHRYANMVPFLVGGHYLFAAKPEVLLPFLGLYLGGLYVGQHVDTDSEKRAQKTVHFCIAPELGMAFDLGHWRPLFIIRYNLAASSGGTGTIGYLNINLGISWDG